MKVRTRGNWGATKRRLVLGLAVATSLAVVVTGCSNASSSAPDRIPPKKQTPSAGTATTHETASPRPTKSPTPTPTPTPTADPATIHIRPGSKADVGPTAPVQVHASGGKLTSVSVRSAGGDKIGGRYNAGHTAWHSSADATLAVGTTYTVTAKAKNADGRPTTSSQTFSTANQQVLGSFITPDGQTVGVGMPLVVKFTAPVANRKAVEKNLKVSVSGHPKLVGAWHWFSATEVHYRPKSYWPGDSTVTLKLNLRGVKGGENLTGIKDKVKTFRTGTSHLIKVNLSTDELHAYQNGKLLRTIPVSGGKPGWETRSGTKVILAKEHDFYMTSSSIGIKQKDDPNYYKVWVKWALRITWSGEFLHSNTWSQWAFGKENTSHGCVGMPQDSMDWLYHWAEVGDPVETVGNGPQMPVIGNGYGDWNMSWSQWKAGSAL